MDSFLEKVISDINLRNADLKSICFILPNKRSSIYFKQKILEKVKKPTFSPVIQSVDSFIIKLSGLNEIRQSEQLLSLYGLYVGLKNNKQSQSLEEFSTWAQTFLKDTSEIEQNLLDVQKILLELIEINKINNWSEEKSIEKEKALFWNLLPELYFLFKKQLAKRGAGSKGMCYREAKENLEHYKEANTRTQHIFVGLNSLSKSEEVIINELLTFNNGEVYWDIDKEFLRNKSHGASFFLKKYKNNWKRFDKLPFKWTGDDYLKKKNIHILGTPKIIGQAKAVGKILSTLDQKKSNKNIVVLGDESIITPLLNYIPKESKDLNITIKPILAVKEMKNLISEIFAIQMSTENSRELNFLKLSSLRLVKGAFPLYEKLEIKEKKVILGLFGEWETVNEGLSRLIIFFNALFVKTKRNSNEFIQIKHILAALEQSTDLLETHSFIKELYSLRDIILFQLEETSFGFKTNLNANTQIMGLLESRALDFENVIITSVNEGVLPKGKTYSSLIPYDLRKKYGLLTYGDRDAIYTYHFYRLIKRAKNVFLIYNNFNQGVLGGEKSRFIHQIEIEEKHNIITENFNPVIYSEKKDIELLKSKGALKRLQELGKKGFSPSSLANYLKSPEEFYFKSLLNIYDNEQQDSINPRTIGLIFHDSLEAIYLPFVNKILDKEKMFLTKILVNNKVKESFVKNNIKDYNKGKKLIAFEVIKKAIMTLIENEIKDLEQGNVIEILSLEKKIECNLELKDFKHPVKIKGIIDRLDKRNGIIRVVDYKTGLISPGEVSVKDISSCFGAKHLKSMQLLCYALMYFKNNPKCLDMEAGLISFRDLNKGLMKFGTKESLKKIDHKIDLKKIEKFEMYLKDLILEIMNPNYPFLAK